MALSLFGVMLTIICSTAGPVVSDNGNFIIDAPFGREHMLDPYVVSVLRLSDRLHSIKAAHLLQIMAQIKMLTGVVEVGLFCKMAKAAYFGNAVSRPVENSQFKRLITHVCSSLGWFRDCQVARWESRTDITQPNGCRYPSIECEDVPRIINGNTKD